MGLENVANENAQVSFSNNSGPADLVYSGDQPVDTSPAAVSGVMADSSAKVAAAGSPVLITGITIVWVPSGCAFTSATHTFVAGGGAIVPSATKIKVENQLVMLENDGPATPPGIGCVGSWTQDGSGPPLVVVPCACDIAIASAGQTKVKAQ